MSWLDLFRIFGSGKKKKSVNRTYFSIDGKPYDPLRDGYGHYYRDENDMSWWSGSIGAGSAQMVVLLPWMADGRIGSAHADLVANPDYQFMLAHRADIYKHPEKLVRYDKPAAMNYDDWQHKYHARTATGKKFKDGSPVMEPVRNPATGEWWTRAEVISDSGLAETQYEAYYRHRIYPLTPKPDFSRPGYYCGAKFIG